MSENKSIPTELTFREKATKEDLVQVCSVNYSMLVSKIMNSYQNDYIMKCSRHGFTNSQWFLVKFCWKLWIGFTFITFQNIKVPNLFMLIMAWSNDDFWNCEFWIDLIQWRILNWPEPNLIPNSNQWTQFSRSKTMNSEKEIWHIFLFYFFQMRANMGDEEIPGSVNLKIKWLP